MANYGVTRNRLYKIITGKSRPGGSQYPQGLEKEPRGKISEIKLKEANIKLVDIKTETPKGKGRGKSTKKK